MMDVLVGSLCRRTSTLLFVVAGSLMLSGCAADDDPGASAPTSSQSPTSGESAASTELDTKSFVATAIDVGPSIVPGSTIEVSFIDGTIVVKAGCNTMTGGVSLDDGKLTAEHLASTLMACEEPLMAQDTWLSQFLDSSPAWTLNAGTLTLDNGTEKITFQQS